MEACEICSGTHATSACSRVTGDIEIALLHQLDQIRDEIFRTVDNYALRLGALVARGKEVARSNAEYERWVDEELPFSVHTAKRLRAIHLAFRELPAEMLEQMPRPWQALYALTSVPRPQLEAAIDRGEVHAELSVNETRAAARVLRGRPAQPMSRTAALVERLVRIPASELDPEQREALTEWLAAAE